MKRTTDEKILKKFGQHLAGLRHSKGFSLRKLGDQADVDFSQIHRIEKGEVNPSLLILISLAEALNIPLSALVTW
jgi:transcriptional regulator with XRE-family HTH domain